MKISVRLQPTLNWEGFRDVQSQVQAFATTQAAAQVPVSVELDFSQVKTVYPNGAVPLVVWADRCQSLGEMRVSVTHTEHLRALYKHDYLAYLTPEQGIAAHGGATALHPFADDNQLNHLINHKIDQVLGQANFSPGVLTAFEWFLNEIAGNVLVHSQAQRGWMQVLVTPRTRHLSVVVADAGIGIPASISQSPTLHKQFGADLNDGAAIEISLRDGITSKPDYGQGKGLTGTMSIVKVNPGGRLAITSQSGRVVYAADKGLKIREHEPPFQGTVVDVQLDFSHPLAIEQALWGHVPVNFTELVYGKNLPVGTMRMVLRDHASSFGNRITAGRIRKHIENLLTEAPTDALEIDFEGVSILASSFADEVFGKLAVKLGVVTFSRRLHFVHLNAFCQGIIDDVVQTRMAQTHALQHPL